MSLLNVIDGAERRSFHPRDPALIDLLGSGSMSNAGVSVTPERAMGVMAIYAAVRLISETLATLPLGVYKQTETGGRERARAHRLNQLLQDEPNEFQTSFEFFEMGQSHVLLRGASYAKIEETKGGNIEQLIPLHPDRTRPRYERLQNGARKTLFFAHDPLDGSTEIYLPHEILYVPGLSSDGIRALSPLAIARETIGLAIAAEEHGARHLANNVQPGGVLEHPQRMEDDVYEKFKADWHAFHAGVKRAGKTVILEEGMKWHQIGLTNKDAQFIESRKFQVREIARMFKVPPHMIGDLEQATFSNIEHQAIEFVVHTMLPWLVRWEKRLKKSLLGPTEQKSLFFKFIADGLLRGDTKSRYESYAIARQWGWFSADDVRELEDKGPLPDGQGKIYFVPMNMIPADQAALPPAPVPPALLPPSTDPAAAPDDEPEEEEDLRTRRARSMRNRIEMAHVRLFVDGVNRVLRKEIEAARRAVAKARAAGNSQALERFAEEFYGTHEEFIQRALQPTMSTTADAIAIAVASEVGIEDDDVRGLQLEVLAQGLAQNAARRHIERQRSEVRGLLASTTSGFDAFDRLVTEWEARAGAIAGSEIDLVSAAVQAAVYGAAGMLPARIGKSG